jgi:hypothetical protein
MKKPTQKRHKFKYKKLKKPLNWLDCVGQTGWLSSKEMDEAKPVDCVTGEFWIYKDTKTFITLFGTYVYLDDGEIQFGDVITIPKHWI